MGFFVTQISQMTQIFIHRMTRNLFGGFLRRRLLTDFRGGDLFGRCRYPLGLDKAIHQRFHKKSVKSVGQKNSHEKNLRHLRNLRDLKNVPRKIMKQNPPRKTCETKEQRKRRTKTTISSWFSNEYRNHATVLALRLTLKDDPNLRMLPVSSPT